MDSIKEFIKSNKSILKIQQRFKSERHNVLKGKGLKILTPKKKLLKKYITI